MKGMNLGWSKLLWPIALVLMLASAQPVKAESDNQLRQYRHKAWRASEGWFEGAVNTLAQGADGYLWVGTVNGVYRFDGVKFEPLVRPDRRPFGFVYDLLLASDGTMWIASERGLSFWRDGELHEVPSTGGLITSVFQDREKTIWVTRSSAFDDRGPICRVTPSNTFECFGHADGIATNYAQKIVEDANGDYWIAAGALTRWRPGQQGTEFFRKELAAYGTGWGVQTLMIDSDGSLLAGLSVFGPTAGLQRYKDGRWSVVTDAGFDGGKHSASRMLRDRAGALWLESIDDGLLTRLQGGHEETFTPTQGLSGEMVSAIVQDREGTIWVGTDQGLDSFVRPAVLTYTEKDGSRLKSNVLLADETGTLWLGRPEVATFVDGEPHPLSLFQNNGTRGFVNSMLQDREGRLWVAIYNTLYLVDGKALTKVRDSTGLDHLAEGDIVKSMVEDIHGVIWGYVVGKQTDRLIRITRSGIADVRIDPKRDRMRWLAADKFGGLWLAGATDRLVYLRDGQEKAMSIPTSGPEFSVNEILLGSDDVLYISSSQGLIALKDNVWRAIGISNGLPCSSVDSTVLSQDGAAWLSMRCGLARVGRADLDQLRKPFEGMVHPRLFTSLDGWSPSISIASHKSVRTADGRLWFSNLDGVQMVDPEHLHSNPLAPPVVVERILSDRQVFGASDSATVPPNPKSIEIDYTALSLVEPRQMSFKYRLVGHDVDWQQPGLRRQAFYNDLAPGRYRFEVLASNNSGLWTEEPATAELIVLPTFYQTAAFKALCVAAVVLLLWLTYALRIRSITMAIEWATHVQSLERQRIARDLHDTFFQTMQSLFLRFHTAKTHLPESSSSAKDTFDAILTDSDLAMEEGRRLFLDSALDEIGDSELCVMLEKISAGFSTAYRIPCSIQRDDNVRLLKPRVKDEAYKLAREALYNAFRHAKPSIIKVGVSYGDDKFILRVVDDGQGLEATRDAGTGRRAHWGLKSMAARAKSLGGRLNILSQLGRGTQVEFVLDASRAYET